MKRYVFNIVLTVFFILCVNLSYSQKIEPVKWVYKVERLSNNEVNIKIVATIENGWHLYSQYNTEGITGQTVFDFEASEFYKLIGKTSEPEYKEITDELGTDRYFDLSTVVFVQKVKILSEKDFKIKAGVHAQACTAGRCVQLEEDWEIPMRGCPQIEEIEEKSKEISENEFEEAGPDSDSVNINVKTSSSDKLQAKPSIEHTEKKAVSLWAVFFIALGAGLLTLLTPCVFPLIPMTINFFMHGSGKNKKSGMRQAWLFGGSIVFIYVVLGVVLALIFGPKVMYVIATHWIPNLIFFAIFMLFALSFFGLFEITMPSWMINKSDAKADKGGLLGPFFIALTTVLVSFSCTGPILGAALVGLCTSGSDRLIPLLSMLGFGIGFAAPFTLLAMFPSVLSKWKSGGWLNTVKIVFAFLEIAFGLKFLSMADLYCGWRILDREVFLAIWIVVFALLGFYLLGKIRFAGDSEVREVSVLRLFLSILTFSFVIYMIPGMFGAPLKAISGFIPPMETQDFDVNKIVYENVRSIEAAGISTTTSLPADRKYVNELEMPTGFEGFYDLEEAKAYAKKVNKPIFLDFTGKTCANCREMEHYVWIDEDVKNILRQKFIICSLYADSKIKLPESEWVKDENGKNLKTLGQKNLNYQEVNFNINSQPYYVLLDGDGKILTKKNHQYDRDVKEFLDFLNEGLENYNKGSVK